MGLRTGDYRAGRVFQVHLAQVRLRSQSIAVQRGQATCPRSHSKVVGRARTRKESPDAWPGHFPSWQSHPLSSLPQGLDTRKSQILLRSLNPTPYSQLHKNASSEGHQSWGGRELFPQSLGLTGTPGETGKDVQSQSTPESGATPWFPGSLPSWRLLSCSAGPAPLYSQLAPYLPT